MGSSLRANPFHTSSHVMHGQYKNINYSGFKLTYHYRAYNRAEKIWWEGFQLPNMREDYVWLKYLHLCIPHFLFPIALSLPLLSLSDSHLSPWCFHCLSLPLSLTISIPEGVQHVLFMWQPHIHLSHCTMQHTHTPLNLYLAGWCFSVGAEFDKVRLLPWERGS